MFLGIVGLPLGVPFYICDAQQQPRIDLKSPFAAGPLGPPAAVPGFHPPGVPAISDAQLREIGRRHLPVVVVNATLPPPRSVSILGQVNAVSFLLSAALRLSVSCLK